MIDDIWIYSRTTNHILPKVEMFNTRVDQVLHLSCRVRAAYIYWKILAAAFFLCLLFEYMYIRRSPNVLDYITRNLANIRTRVFYFDHWILLFIITFFKKKALCLIFHVCVDWVLRFVYYYYFFFRFEKERWKNDCEMWQISNWRCYFHVFYF